MPRSDIWTEEQITIVLYEYCRKPFGQFSKNKQFVKDLGQLIGRSPDAVVRKVGNIASFDENMKARGVDGLPHTAKNDKIVWDRYNGNWEQLTYDAEMLISKYRQISFEDSISIDKTNLPVGQDRICEIKTRLGQDFFRKTVMVSYNQQCCITGMSNASLIQACHIVDWSKDANNRTNPRNGLYMNILFHKAYDENLLGITPDYKIKVSDEFFGKKIKFLDSNMKKFIEELNNRTIILPKRFLPDKELLAEHYEQFLHRNN